jgi:hypothetical protein
MKFYTKMICVDLLHWLVWIFIIIGALCWTLILVEGVDYISPYLRHDMVHALGMMFIAIFIILFPLNYLLRRSDLWFKDFKREIVKNEQRRKLVEEREEAEQE